MGETKNQGKPKNTPLKRGWTTGACATAAAKSALSALLGNGFLDPVTIALPGGQNPAFVLCNQHLSNNFAIASIIKDAGDDPDVTHGATISAKISHGKPGSGVTFIAGEGVGTFTKPGLPYDIGQPAINPKPREMMKNEIKGLCAQANCTPDFVVSLSVPNGEKIAQKTWNPRLGILGGISILGTTGIVIPYSCSAWIHAIHSGVDVACAQGLTHLVGTTGDRSEKTAQEYFDLPVEAFIDMGDFVGGLLKYVRKKPIEHLTIAGGFAKISKLAQGAMDLHSGRSQVDIAWLTDLLKQAGVTPSILHQCETANNGNHVLQIAQSAQIELGDIIATKAENSARAILKQSEMRISILVIDRSGEIVGRSGLET